MSWFSNLLKSNDPNAVPNEETLQLLQVMTAFSKHQHIQVQNTKKTVRELKSQLKDASTLIQQLEATVAENEQLVEEHIDYENTLEMQYNALEIEVIS